MDGFIGLSSRRSNKYNANLGIQKIGMLPLQNPPVIQTNKIQVVGYYESSVSVTTVLGTGITSPRMYLKAGDVLYVMGCEGYIGSTTITTAATTFTNQGRVTTTWQPYISNVRTGITTFATYQEAAMLNARQNQWSPGNFLSTDWASVAAGSTATLGTYRSFLALKIIQVPTTGAYTVNTAYGPRGTGTTARHVYCIAFRGVDTARLTTAYYEPAAGKTQFIKSPRSRITTGIFAVGLTSTGPDRIDAFQDFDVYTIGPGGQDQPGRVDRNILVGMVPELDVISDATGYVKNDPRYTGWVGSLWTDQYDGTGGLSSMCGLDSAIYPTFSQTYNHTGGLALTPSLLASSCYAIIVPAKG
jgi:hypothetical protein